MIYLLASRGACDRVSLPRLPESAGHLRAHVDQQVWDPNELAALVALCDVGFDLGALTEDDLEMCFASDEAPLRAVLGTADGTACVAVQILDAAPPGSISQPRIARVELVVTHPSRRRRGLARSLLEAAEGWARDQGAQEIRFGGGRPLGLFSGVDVRWTAALCLAESLGYESEGLRLDFVCPTVQPTRMPGPLGIQVARVESEEQIQDVLQFVQQHAPADIYSFHRAASAGTAVLAQGAEGGEILGVAVHSVRRLGVIGPFVLAQDGDSRAETAVQGSERVQLLSALLATIRSDLSIAGMKSAEILGGSPLSPLVAACDARSGRVSQIYSRDLLKHRAS